MLIIKTKKDIVSYIETSPVVLECKKVYDEDDGPESEEFEEVKEELLKLILAGDLVEGDSPDFGDDWETWLTKNIEEFLREAISIVA